MLDDLIQQVEEFGPQVTGAVNRALESPEGSAERKVKLTLTLRMKDTFERDFNEELRGLRGVLGDES